MDSPQNTEYLGWQNNYDKTIDCILLVNFATFTNLTANIETHNECFFFFKYAMFTVMQCLHTAVIMSSLRLTWVSISISIFKTNDSETKKRLATMINLWKRIAHLLVENVFLKCKRLICYNRHYVKLTNKYIG